MTDKTDELIDMALNVIAPTEMENVGSLQDFAERIVEAGWLPPGELKNNRGDSKCANTEAIHKAFVRGAVWYRGQQRSQINVAMADADDAADEYVEVIKKASL